MPLSARYYLLFGFVPRRVWGGSIVVRAGIGRSIGRGRWSCMPAHFLSTYGVKWSLACSSDARSFSDGFAFNPPCTKRIKSAISFRRHGDNAAILSMSYWV